MLHPVAILAVALLLVNDHLLKAVAPGLLTGKLSDLAGMVFFPILLAELARVFARHVLRRRVRVAALMPGAVVATALVLIAVKTSPVAAMAWATSLGALQWLIGVGWMRGVPLKPVAVVVDPTDLIALPMLLIPLVIAHRSRAVDRRQADTPRTGVRPGSARRRAAGVAMAIVAGISSIATAPPPPSPIGTLEAEVTLSDVAPIAVRHIAWSVPDTGRSTSGLRVVVGTYARNAPTGEYDPVFLNDVRVVPDDTSLVGAVRAPGGLPGPETIDLSSACEYGCTSGATIVMRLQNVQPNQKVSTRLVIALRSNGSVSASGDGAVSLAWDPRSGEDQAPATVSSGDRFVPLDVNKARPAASATVTMHIAAAALQAPLSGLRGSLDTFVGFVDEKYGRGLEQEITIGSLAPFDASKARTEVDWLRQCSAGVECVITMEVTLSTRPEASPRPPGEPDGTDYYRWFLNATIEALDGRTLPPDAIRILDAAGDELATW